MKTNSAVLAGLCGLVSVVAGPVVTPAEAQDDAAIAVSSITGSAGNYLKPGRWAEVIVTVANRSDAAAPATITCSLPAAGGGKAYFSRLVELPARSVRQCRMVIRLPEGIAPEADRPPAGPEQRSRATASMPEMDVPFTVSVPGGGSDTRAYAAQVIAADTSAFARLEGLDFEVHDDCNYIADRLAEKLGDIRQVSVGNFESLPERWAGWSMLEVVILGAAAHELMRSSQIEALLDWVRLGGVLVIAADYSMPELLRTRLGRAAGAGALGVHRVEALEVTKLTPDGREHVGRLPLEWPLPMAELYPRGAAVRYEANGLPLLLARRLGRGRILTLAVPAGALDNSSIEKGDLLHSIWHEAFSGPYGPEPPPVDAGRFLAAADGGASPAGRALMSIAGRRTAPPYVPVLILAALAAGTLACGIVFAVRRRGELVWAVLIPAAVIAAAVLYVCGRARVSQEQLSAIGLISPLDGDNVRIQQALAYYSGESTRSVTFSSGEPRATIRRLRPGSMIGRDEIRTAPDLAIPDARVPTASSLGFCMQAVRPMKVISGTLTFDEKGLAGVLRNHLPADITNAVIYANRRTYRLGDRSGEHEDGILPAGGEKHVTVGDEQFLAPVRFIAADEAEPAAPRPAGEAALFKIPTTLGPKVARGEFTGAMRLARRDLIRNRLVGDLAYRPQYSLNFSRRAVLIGYTAHWPADPLSGRRLRRQGWTVVVWPLELTAPAKTETPATVYVPAGFVEVYVSPAKADVRYPGVEEIPSSYVDAEFVLAAAPPAGLVFADECTLKITLSLRAVERRLTIAGVTGTSAAEGTITLAEFDNPKLVNKTVTVDDAGRFRGKDGNYRFLLKLERIGDKTRARRDAAMSRAWSFERLDVAMKGKLK